MSLENQVNPNTLFSEVHDCWRSFSIGLDSYSDREFICNVALLGLSGHGKSSYARSIKWLLQLIGSGHALQRPIQPLPPIRVGGGIGAYVQVTEKFEPHTVRCTDKFSVKLGDLRGVTSAEMENVDKVIHELNNLSEGKISEKEQMDMARGWFSRLLKNFFCRGSPMQRITQFVLVHRFDKVKRIFHSDHIGRWIPLLAEMRKAGYKDPLIVITGCDLVPSIVDIDDPKEDVVISNMGQAYEPSSVESVRKYIRHVLNVDDNDIFFVTNYLEANLQGNVENGNPVPAIELLKAFSQSVKRGVERQTSS